MRDPAQPPTSETPIPGSSGGNVGAVQREMDANDDDPERSDNDSSNASSDDSEQITVVSESIASSDGKKTKGKDGDPDDDGDGPSTEADKWEDWLSPHHAISMQIQLQRNGDRPPIQVDIACQTQFKTYADERMPLDPNIEWTRQAITRPQAQVHTEFKLRFMSEGIILDRSYAVLGLQGHRPYSIIDDQNLDCGFEEPTKTLKTIFSENIQNSLGVTAGFTGVHPAPTVKATYSRNKSSTHGLEATDSEPAPLYTVTPSPGESYLQREGKSYRSYNYAYAARDDLFCRKDRKMPPPTIGFAYGINFNHYNSEHERLSPPRVSYINRNQIFVWVEDPSLRSKILGTVMLFSDYVKNIRTPSQLTTVNECTVELETGKKIHSFSSVARDARDGAISLDVVPVHQEKYIPEAVQYKGPSTLKRLGTRAAQAAQKISRRPPSPQLTLVPQEVVARGWDVTNCRWRDAIYPELDKHLRVPRAEDPSLVAFQISSYELPVP
ncbi:hypothetical protein B0H11DRAFT_2027947 [Mycena galericulata]|nr:hypothetical protein B0H11DRAFT_2027947 [Mycena galericulata]